MRLAAIFAMILSALAACSSATARARSAERQYEMVKQRGAGARERCDSARIVAQAWLAAENRAEFERWSVQRDLDCNRALIDSL